MIFWILIGALCFGLVACAPRYNWRDFHSPHDGYSILFPAKPASLTRAIDLNGTTVSMTMNGAEVDGISFTVGSVQMHDATQAQAAAQAMRTALLRNMNGAVASAGVAGPISQFQAPDELRASAIHNGVLVRLIGRFSTRGTRVYQIVVLGPERDIQPEQVATFMDSFTLN